MVIKIFNEKHKHLLFIDIEFDSSRLIQFAALLFTKIEAEENGNIYQLEKSYNAYVVEKVGYPFMEYTNITNTWLTNNGVPIEDIKKFIYGDLLADVDYNELLVISHGLKNDRIILNRNGINLSNYVSKDGRTLPIDGYCTYNNSKRIFNRDHNLTLEDLADECGYFLHGAHNAYNDVWAEVSIFTTIKKIEESN